MQENQSSRRQEILKAAQNEYIKNGSAAARMQAIADNVGVTKAMIHYYFDTKEKLFRHVFKLTCREVFGNFMEILETEDALFQKIDSFVKQTVKQVHRHPKAASFVITELNHHPELTVDLFRDSLNYNSDFFAQQLKKAASNYEIAPVDSKQVVANILSLCLFPYSGNKFMKEFLQLKTEQEYDRFLEQRSVIISDTVINWLAS